MKLTKKQIVAICDSVIQKMNTAKKTGKIAFIDVLLKTEIQNIKYAERYDIDIEKFIPEFTLQNATIMAGAEVSEIDPSFWWAGADLMACQIKFMEFIKDCYTSKN